MSSAPAQPDDLTVVVLAAGGGTRMKSKTMKVLHPISGRSMLGHVLHAVRSTRPRRVVAVIGTQREQVGPHVLEHVPDALLAVQETPEGTAHAVRAAVETLLASDGDLIGTVLVTAGDTPMLEGESLRDFVADHRRSGRAVSILTGRVADPTGYGRIVREPDGSVAAIVEEKEASDYQREINEINSGILAFDAAFLRSALPRIDNDNAKGEYYLTDAIALARADGLQVGAFPVADVTQTEGANDRAQLADLAREMNQRILRRWMREGVTVLDPLTTWVDADVVLAPDVTILPGVQLLGTTIVNEDAVIGPDSTLRDVEVGQGAKVVRTHAELAVIGPAAQVGPFSYLRPGTRIGTQGKVGTFVETKNSEIAAGAKVPHLSYIGDTEIGEGTNIGAGTITANYDGVSKHRTVVGRHARTGSNNTFVAPVRIGDGAVTGAGTTVRKDVPAGALAVSAGTQRHLEEWVLQRRAGTAAAEAAAAALDAERTGEQGSAGEDA